MIIKSTNTDLLSNNRDYQLFLSQNPSRGTLKVRASSVNEALPISNVKVVVSKKIGNDTIIFFEGQTDNSGMINGIKLPTPRKIQNNEEVPIFTEYDLEATYEPSNFYKKYGISLCCGITIIQYINIIPGVNYEMRNYNGY